MLARGSGVACVSLPDHPGRPARPCIITQARLSRRHGRGDRRSLRAALTYASEDVAHELEELVADGHDVTQPMREFLERFTGRPIGVLLLLPLRQF